MMSYFVWLLYWVAIVFLWKGGVSRHGYKTLYGLVMDDMGAKKVLPTGLQHFAPAVFCSAHAIFMLSCMPLVLLGPVLQGVLVSGCVALPWSGGYGSRWNFLSRRRTRALLCSPMRIAGAVTQCRFSLLAFWSVRRLMSSLKVVLG